ncbi:MAG: SUMF1/EgtB/PvdO family nonheme iron enzyme [Treponema sp.]|nr:SUMF1/EgtB/PvdO family nonheme iron enzyme [Treponema sp.]
MDIVNYRKQRTALAVRVAASPAAVLCALIAGAALAGTACRYSASGETAPSGRAASEKKMVLISVGENGQSFKMGGGTNPVRTVKLSEDFLMSNHEVTQGEWKAVFGEDATDNPSRFTGDNLPVENVNWYMAIAYCNKLSRREGLTPCYTVNGITEADWDTLSFSDVVSRASADNDDWSDVDCNWNATGYRLPTEAEWEYAARGGIADTDKNVWAGTTDGTKLGEYAWYSANSGDKTHEVMTKLPNGYGLYDMSGNVREWCWNWNGGYPDDGVTDPKGNPSGTTRSTRGGSFINTIENSAHCHMLVAWGGGSYDPKNGYERLGFRVVRTVTK